MRRHTEPVISSCTARRPPAGTTEVSDRTVPSIREPTFDHGPPAHATRRTVVGSVVGCRVTFSLWLGSAHPPGRTRPDPKRSPGLGSVPSAEFAHRATHW